MSDHGYGVKVWTPGVKRARWVTPNGGLTGKRVHALNTNPEMAAKLAREIAEDNAGVVTKTKAEALS